MLRCVFLGLLLLGCGDDSSPADSGADATSDVGDDAGEGDGGEDAGEDDAGDDAGEDDAGERDAGEDAESDAATDVFDAGRMLEDGQCRTGTDCSGFESCRTPGEFIGCGICMIPLMTCTDDSECTTDGHICDSRPEDCFCGAERTCRAGCSVGDCNAGQECGASGRCEPATCESAGECPTNFDCDETCSRRTCAEDADCEDGWCVNGACHDTPGACTPPVA